MILFSIVHIRTITFNQIKFKLMRSYIILAYLYYNSYYNIRAFICKNKIFD